MASRTTAPTNHSLRSHDVTVIPVQAKGNELAWNWENDFSIDSIDHTYNPYKLGPLKQLLKVDFLESSTEYYLAADLAGVDKNCIEICVEKGFIVLRAERRRSETDHNVKYHTMERNNGRLERFLRIPDDADVQNIVAEFTLGHLEITLPKHTAAFGSVKIPVRFH